MTELPGSTMMQRRDAGANERRAMLLLLCLFLLAGRAWAKVTIPPVPVDVRADQFTITIDGHPAFFSHAAANYYFLNFDLKGKAKISITAPTNDYWAKGVEVQPWRLAIRPEVQGRTIRFTVRDPAKISITRPGDHLAGAEMLFLFANPPEKDAPKEGTPGVRYYKPGVYHENIDVKSGDRIYLADGAVVFGSLNVWQVKDVKVWGRGAIIYDGPQNPNDDDGWMHKRNWHCIVMDNAHRIEIDGITCVVRSRTWMIQMVDTRGVVFDNIKVIGGSKGNANQDGMDWLGGGDTVVRNVFIRAADDVFAMQGNWPGYSQKALTTPGHDVTNILIENSVVSTSISNVMRSGWPQKIFNSKNVTMRDSDVIHMGIGGCGIPFALFEFWGDKGAKGHHSGYHFENIRLEDWYSLVQIQQKAPAIRDVAFDDIWSPEAPSLVPSVLSGDVSGVSLSGVKLPGAEAEKTTDVPMIVESGAQTPTFGRSKSGVVASFVYGAGMIPLKKVSFDASASTAANGGIAKYEWFFGDGKTAKGKMVKHAFPDAMGTLWDGSGRFRVLLKVTDAQGKSAWTAQPVVVAAAAHPAETVADASRDGKPGLNYQYFEGTWEGMPKFGELKPVATGSAEGLDLSLRKQPEQYGMVFDGYLTVPADGGYIFDLLGTDADSLEIDGVAVATSPKPVVQVCGSVGNAVQMASGSMALGAGKHRVRVAMTHTTGDQVLSLKWQGPGLPLREIPKEMFSHAAVR